MLKTCRTRDSGNLHRVTVPQQQVSVSPYPCMTAVPKQFRMNSWTSGESGAPPAGMHLTRPPTICLTLLKMRESTIGVLNPL